ncbi:MAG TPA: VWA domain-containing protein [Thermoanaerobaculia bacterium]
MLVFLAAAAAHGAISFVSPLPNAQALGPTAIEITTDAARVDRVDFAVDGVLAGTARKPPYRIAFDFGTSLAARTITATVWTNGYRNRDSATITTAALTIENTLTVDVVELALRVRASRPLRANDLRVRENGVEQVVREVIRERPPAHFAFVVDRSLSMNHGKLAAALRAIEEQLAQLQPGDRASLVLFNHHVAKARPIARGEHLAIDAAPSGGTSLRDAVASVASRERTYAIVITDGGDRNSILRDEEALRRISGARTTVHAIVLGASHASFLDRAAGNTGGTVIDASAETVSRALGRLLADINSRYLVVYQSAGTKRGWRTIEVRARSGGVEIVSARKEYFAP